MPDFIRRFGQVDSSGNFFLSSSRQSIITSLLSAGYVLLLTVFSHPLTSSDRCFKHLCVRELSRHANFWLSRTGNIFSGALAQAFTSDRFGRRGSILIWSGIFTVGVAVQTATTFSIVQLTIGRFIAGLGVGALSGMFP